MERLVVVGEEAAAVAAAHMLTCISTTSLQNSRIGSAPAGSACNFLTATVRSFAPFTSPSFQIALYTLA